MNCRAVLSWLYDGAWSPTYDVSKMQVLIGLEVMTIIVEAIMLYQVKLKEEDGKRLSFVWSLGLSFLINAVSFTIGMLFLLFTGYFNM